MISERNPSRCWAHALGGCSEKISREHLISAAIFPDTDFVDVSGFPWCQGKIKTVGLASVTSKILCSTHNSLLSPVDSAAGVASKAFNDCAILTNKRLSENSSKVKVRHFRINGILLERWLLKTLINLCSQSGLLIGSKAEKKNIPDESLVRVCFGLERFAGKSGLYLAARVGANVASGPAIGFAPLIFDGTHVAGGFFNFRGFFLFISLFEELLPTDFNWVTDFGGVNEWAGTRPTWHFKKVVVKVNQARSSVVHFDW
jgi:hypothetical protein